MQKLDSLLEEEIFGDQAFHDANPQVQLQMALTRAQDEVERMLYSPCDERGARAQYAVSRLGRLLYAYSKQYKCLDGEYSGPWFFVTEKRE